MSSPDSFFLNWQPYGVHEAYNTGAAYNAYPEGPEDTYLMPNPHTTYAFHRSHSSQDGSDHSGSFVSPSSIHDFLPSSSPSLAPQYGVSSSLSSIEQLEHLFKGAFEPAHAPDQSPDFAANTLLVDAMLPSSQAIAPQYIQTSRTGSPIELSPKVEPEPPAQSHLLTSVPPSIPIPNHNTSNSTDMTSAALDLIGCNELRTNSPLPRKLLIPFLQKIPYKFSKIKGPGSRDGPLAYRCLWSNCDHTPIKRRDHALDHIASHVGSKPYKCSECDLRFLRKADKRRHIESCSHVKNKNERSKSVSIEVWPIGFIAMAEFSAPFVLLLDHLRVGLSWLL